ncbi:MAG TPA: hypothetical protein DDY25_02380 [Peptococcaceae bacterium]|nr:hypothetical protein [Peptococcaceae bacterium]
MLHAISRFFIYVANARYPYHYLPESIGGIKGDECNMILTSARMWQTKRPHATPCHLRKRSRLCRSFFSTSYLDASRVEPLM